jgi:hypothetical protein
MSFRGYALFKEIQRPVRTCNRFEESNVNNSTRPEGQPRHIVDNDTTEARGRYSGGNHSKFSEFQVIHIPSGQILRVSSLSSSFGEIVSVGLYDCWMIEIESSSNTVAGLNGERALALWVQQAIFAFFLGACLWCFDSMSLSNLRGDWVGGWA